MPEPQDPAHNSAAGEEPAPEEGSGLSRMPFLEHLEELRTRIIRSAYAVAVAFIAAYCFKEHLYELLKAPLEPYLPAGGKLIYTAPAELFFTYMKVSALAGVIVSSPVIFYQLWRFVAPGLYEKERRMVWPFVLTSSGLFIAGTAFCYEVVFPVMFKFFMNLSTSDIVPMLKVNEYLSFSSTMLVVFGLVFETPILLFFLAKIGLINSAMLRKHRRYSILGIVVLAAVLSPTPDVFTQLLMAIPLYVLYEFSIILISRVDKVRARREAEQEAEENAE